MAQGVVRPATGVTLAGLALSPAYAYCFVFWLDWRLDGAAIAMSATQVQWGRAHEGRRGGVDPHQLPHLPG